MLSDEGGGNTKKLLVPILYHISLYGISKIFLLFKNKISEDVFVPILKK